MLLLMKNKYRKQKGFSLLEALLAIVIIVAAGLGVVELFISADKKNKAEATQTIVQQTASAVSQLLSTTYDTAQVIDTSTVAQSGLLPQNVVVGTTIKGPYGDIEANSLTHDEYYVIAKNVPGDQAVTLCQNMFSTAAIFAAIPTADGKGTSLTTVALCQSTFGGKSSTRSSVYFAFPREFYIAS